ncbi:MAG: PRC-barrel domain-containing protein [Arenicellales bacterium]
MKYVILAAALVLTSAWTRHYATGAEQDTGRETVKAARPAVIPSLARAGPCGVKALGFISTASIPVSHLLGMRVTNPLGEDIGHITDMILDRRGCATSVVMQVGGFMGLIGGRQVTLSLDKLRIRAPDDTTALRAVVFETKAHILRNFADRGAANGGD